MKEGILGEKTEEEFEKVCCYFYVAVNNFWLHILKDFSGLVFSNETIFSFSV